MLHILWILLKIIGIIILVVLGLVLVTFGVVFLVPLKYCGSAELNKEIERSSANVKFSWLLHLVSGNVNYKNKHLTYELRILGKKLQLDKKDDNSDVDAEHKSVEETVDGLAEEVNKESQKEFSVDSTKEFASNLAKKITEEVAQDTVGTNEKETKKSKKSVKKKKIKKESLLKKIKYTFQNICDKIKMLKQKKDEIETFLKNESHRLAFKKIWKEFGKLLKAVKPSKLKLNAHFGFEDPSLTGKVLAVLSMLYPFYGVNIIIQPDFENVLIEGDLYLKGKIRIVYAVKMAWNLIWDKNFRITLKDILKWIR